MQLSFFLFLILSLFLSSRVFVLSRMENCDNVPNDVLFSREDVDLPAGRKTVAGALNLE